MLMTMLSRQWLNMAKILRSVPARTPLRYRSLRNASTKSPFVDGGERPTMNDLPIPDGDWAENYARKNMKNTFVLLTGIVMFTTSLYMHITDENVDWYFKVPEYDRCR
ncbi:uncharacterized protein [Eurosta solidaginis]|uniref:uncharacterized protein n=1 Tax=Eurosta solidaginis TaxID=178769 RepID=UPI003530DAD1